MSIEVQCNCGKVYHVKVELEGKQVQCPACGDTMLVPDEVSPTTPQSDSAFERDRFLLRQKHLAINEKYYIWDEEGKPILFVERPAYLLRGCLSIVAAVIVGFVCCGLACYAASFFKETSGYYDLIVSSGTIGSIVLAITTFISLLKKRHVTFYRDDTRQEILLSILQDKKVHLLTANYSIIDKDGNYIASLKKNFLLSILRKSWHCTRSDGSAVCVAKEDTIILSLLRRLLGSLFGLLRANFIILRSDGKTREPLGELNRKYTLLDRYVLDLTMDSRRTLDRRLALAIGVMLDTGERR